MDFMTSLPYWGILVIIIVNALIVRRMTIDINDPSDEETDE